MPHSVVVSARVVLHVEKVKQFEAADVGEVVGEVGEED